MRISPLYPITLALFCATVIGCSKEPGGTTGAGGAQPDSSSASTDASSAPSSDAAANAGGGSEDATSTRIVIDGSSTVYPITSAAADEFKASVRTDANISVGLSGTGGGFKKFIKGEIDICDASRPVKSTEKEELAKAGVEYVEFTIAQDGMAIVVHKDNDWVDCITVEQLKKMWAPSDSAPKKWNEINPKWPNEPLDLYGAGTDSGTFEFFTEAIVGKAKESRSDYNPSENDSQLVTGVAGSRYSLGYFGLGYYMNNTDKLKLLAIDNGDGNCVQPSEATVTDGTYKPLSRPLFIYVSKKAMARPIVQEFIKYYLENAAELAKSAFFIAPSEAAMKANQEVLAGAAS